MAGRDPDFWTRLEQAGAIPPSPGRKEAVKATLEHIARKKTLAEQERIQKATRKRKSRKRHGHS